ncbi:MAG: macro domain-containing protein [Candidatus Omnitrophica bacterium]|nr:macro domain-containing protein [Candidatus Omnitrophota bacterium]
MIQIKQGDITRENVAVIVNAANTQLKGGGGVDGAIHKAAGPSVMEECRSIGRCPTGKAVITNAGDLFSEMIIHTVGPVWKGGRNNECELLKDAYENSFLLALDYDLTSIAFPSISTGAYGFPKETAARIALRTGLKYYSVFERIVYVCFSKEDYDLYLKVYNELTS